MTGKLQGARSYKAILGRCYGRYLLVFCLTDFSFQLPGGRVSGRSMYNRDSVPGFHPQHG